MSGALDSPAPASTALYSVMLWAVDPKLPFDQGDSNVADAGFHAIELVGEWEGWSRDGLTRARQQLHRLGLVVAACSGIDASLCDPSQRDAVLSQIRAILPILAEFESAPAVRAAREFAEICLAEDRGFALRNASGEFTHAAA